MFDFGKSLINMNPDEQQELLKTATPAQKKTALELGVGFNNQNRQQQRRQKRDAFHDLDRLNHVVEKENEAHDFFGKGLADWQKNVTGKNPSKDANGLKKQFDDYEHTLLAEVPKGGKRHGSLSESITKIKNGFLKQGHRFAVDKLNERSKSVLDTGLQRIAQGALGAKDDKDVQAHDDAAFDLINKYVTSEAKFDEKDADAMYDKYLGYAGVDVEETRASENEDISGAKPGFKMEDTVMLAENDDGTMSDAGSGEDVESKDGDLQIPEDQKEAYDGNQYRGKVADNQEEGKEAPDKSNTPNKKELAEATGKPASPEQRAELRKITPEVPDSVKGKEDKPYTPAPYDGRKFNTKPGGEGGPSLTFDNDKPDNPSPDQAVHPNLAKAVEEVAAETGLDLNINSTTGGTHSSSKSRHYQGKAVDINKINGLPVNHSDNKENVKKLQEAMNKHKGMRECFGPHSQEQIKGNGREEKPGMAGGHKGHIHFSVQ